MDEEQKAAEEEEGEGKEDDGVEELGQPTEEEEGEGYKEHKGEDDYYYPPIPATSSDIIKFPIDDQDHAEDEEEEEEEEEETDITARRRETPLKSDELVKEEKAGGEEDDDDEEEEEEGEAETEEVRRISEVELEDELPMTSLLAVRAKDRTMSEAIFEEQHRAKIEEETKKIIERDETETEALGKREMKRKPVLKKRISITEVDVSGLYPPPKAIISEVSFIYEEDDGMREQKLTETDADIVQFIINAVQDGIKHDLESIFVRGLVEDIAKVRKVIEETIMKIRRGLKVNIPKIVNEALADMKQNLRSVLISRLREKLGKFETITEEEEGEEEEEYESVGEKEVKGKEIRKRKIKKAKMFERKKSERGEEEDAQIEEGAVEKMDEEMQTEQELAKEEEELKIPYEQIDWAKFLTDSEAKFEIDPEVKQEMDEYIARRKAELEAERKLMKEQKAKEQKYVATDPQMHLANENLTVTMKFALNTGDIYTCAYKFFMTFKDIKEDLAGIFRIPPDVLIIYRDEAEIEDHQSAYDLDIEPFDCVTFRLLTLDNDRWPLKSWHTELPVPDIITCTVETGQDHLGNPEYKEVVVEIENRKIKKPFVGGYKDVKTGIEYHHAFTQSAPHPPKLPVEKRNTRDTQTALVKKKLVDTVSDKTTQMSRPDCFISTDEDKILTAKPYVDYDSWCRHKDIEGKVRIIQRYLRAWILKKYVKMLSEEYRRRKAWEDEQERKRLLEREKRIKNDIVNMTYPKTKADFNMLYSMVERWRKAQVERISKLKTEAPKRAEFCSVLEKEIKLLEAIEVHRIAILKEQRKRRNLKFMEKVSKPVTWTGYRGITIKMDTLKTQRARELKELYLSLSRGDLNYQDRIELLMSLKYALKVHSTRLTNELTELISRECDLLIRGVSPKNLEFLRRRIEHLFELYFKEPDFNPEMAKYDPEYNRDPYKENILFCKLCHKMKLYKEFSITAREQNVNVCESCQWVHNIAVPRVDLNPYRYILRTVRRDEQKRNCYSSCAFVLQEEDMRFLVENIWHNRSAVSECDNLVDLRMPRWDVTKDWTPWNCILLTENEAKAHLKTDPSDNYDKHLLGEIKSKHELAKRHFQQLFAADKRIRDCGKWANVVDVKEYVPPPLEADIWDLTEEECDRIKTKGSLYEVHETARKLEGYVKEI